MQFNSFIYILLFFPITVLFYFLLNKVNVTVGKIVLIIASLIFYSYFDLNTLTILGFSVVINLAFALVLEKTSDKLLKCHKFFMAVPVITNVGLLLYYKYLNFAITNINQLFGKDISLKNLVLPIGISFFTFQQIAYIVTVYKKEIKVNIIDYLTFILYFPKILMGPLMEPTDFMSQINDSYLKKINWDNIAYGVKIFSFGLFKKAVLADVFAKAVNFGFSNYIFASSIDWFLVMIFYVFELYFDFSGYTDMAVGSSIMLNITLPINFDSPLKATSVQDLWKRWHISLSRFLIKYIYIPLGGSRKGLFLTCVNTMIIFLISGLWHGANWTFILWGAIHGGFLVLERLWGKYYEKVWILVRRFITFMIFNFTCLLFRSDSVIQWLRASKTMVSLKNPTITPELLEKFNTIETTVFNGLNPFNGFWMLVYVVAAMIICFVPENNYKNLKKLTPVSVALATLAFIWGFISLSGESVFVYFNF